MGRLCNLMKFGGLAALGLLSLAMLFVGLPGSGWRGLSVQTGSMRPSLEPGDLVLTRRVAAEQLRVGDVVTYGVPNQRQTITHRIVEIRGSGNQPRQFVLKGDANSAPDPPIFEQQIVGKVARSLPLLGKLTDALRTPLGLALLVYIPALSVVWGELKRLSRHYELKEIKLPPKRKILILRPNMLGALIVAVSLFQAVPALAALQTTAQLTGNTISAAAVSSPGCRSNGNTSIIINNNSNQTSTTGNAIINGNTNGGSATSGDASNSNNTSITIDIC